MKLPNVRSFRDANPYLVGGISVLVIGALTGFAFMVGLLRLFEDTYTVRGIFSDSGGLRSGDEVKVAGVKAGRVTGVKVDREDGRVVVDMVVNAGVDLGPAPTAEIALETLLGSKYVRLGGKVHEPFLADLPSNRRVIPVARTKVPFEIFELGRIGTRAVQQTDTEKLNRFVTDLADITQGKRERITDLVNGLDQVAAAINEREAQLRSLLDRAETMTATLEAKDDTLVALIDQSRAILTLLDQRRGDVAAALRDGDAATAELARLLEANQASLQSILDSLAPVLDVVDRHQTEVDRVLALAGPGFLTQAQAGSHGPWLDIYVRSLGPDVVQVLHDLVATTVEGGR